MKNAYQEHPKQRHLLFLFIGVLIFLEDAVADILDDVFRDFIGVVVAREIMLCSGCAVDHSVFLLEPEGRVRAHNAYARITGFIARVPHG